MSPKSSKPSSRGTSMVDAALARMGDPTAKSPREPRATELTEAELRELADVGRITFESVEDPCTATNDHHVQLLLGELPWMRMGVAILNMNDSEMEARVREADEEFARLLMELADTLTGIGKRH